MISYKKMYYRLFNRITDALRQLERGNITAACDLLKQAQLETEQMYIDRVGEATDD